MFRRLQLQLTVFSTLITGGIVIAMTCLCLLITESNMSRQSFLTFKNNMHAGLSYLESQTIITHKWLSEFQHTYGCQLRLYDGDKLFFYNQIHEKSTFVPLFDAALKQARSEYGIEPDLISHSPLTKRAEFILKASSDYYACVAIIPKAEYQSLTLVALYSLKKEQTAIQHQRFLYFGGALASILLLAIFAWFFTRQILLPLKKNRRQQTQFIAAASHELRSPLAVILSSLAAMKDAPDHMQQQFADNIKSEGLRMNRLISDMLTLANADSQNWSMMPAPVEPDTLLLELYEHYQPLAAQKEISLEISLPQYQVQIRQWDRGRILQVLSILCDNALTYAPQKSTVHLTLTEKNGQTVFTVADHGPGIPADCQDAIFRRFYRIDPSHHQKEHFGLGLCIAKEILSLHHGTIRVEDTTGGGATFVVTL